MSTPQPNGPLQQNMDLIAELMSREPENYFFSEQENQFMDYVEQTWTADQRLPTPSECASILGISEGQFVAFVTNNHIMNELEGRGVTVRTGKMLTSHQIVAAGVLLDPSDRRTEAAKLRELGIDSRTWNNWKRDPVFGEYLRKRGEAVFGDNQHETMIALQQNIRKGDMRAIKLALEMSGRWSSKTVGEVNIEFLLMKILEILQTHISDPQTLAAISSDVAALGTTAAQQRRGDNQLPAPVAAPKALPVVIDMDSEVVRGFQM